MNLPHKNILPYILPVSALTLIIKYVLSKIIGGLEWILVGKLVEVEKKILDWLWEKVVKLPTFLFSLFIKIEHNTVEWFSEVCQSPHWFFFWMVYAGIWLYIRQVIHPSWYSDSVDFVIVTISYSIIPFWVENSVKVSQSNQIQTLIDQISLIEDQQELLAKLTESNIDLSQKILLAFDPNTILSKTEDTSNGYN